MSSMCQNMISPGQWRLPEPKASLAGMAVPDAFLDLVARGHVIDRPDLAALEAGNNPLQTLPSPVHVQQGLSLVECPVVFGRSGHGLSVLSPPRLEDSQQPTPRRS